MGPSWRNANLICQQEDKYFKTKRMLLRQLAPNTLKMLLEKKNPQVARSKLEVMNCKYNSACFKLVPHIGLYSPETFQQGREKFVYCVEGRGLNVLNCDFYGERILFFSIKNLSLGNILFIKPAKICEV